MSREQFVTPQDVIEAEAQADTLTRLRRAKYVADEHLRWLTGNKIASTIRIHEANIVPTHNRLATNHLFGTDVHAHDVHAHTFALKASANHAKRIIPQLRPMTKPHIILSSGLYYQDGYRSFLASWQTPGLFEKFRGQLWVPLYYWEWNSSGSLTPDLYTAEERVKECVEKSLTAFNQKPKLRNIGQAPQNINLLR